jgi:hypothetical protein
MDDRLAYRTIALEWPNPYLRPDVPRYVDSLLDRMKDLHVEVFSYTCDSGGFPLYTSSLAPHDPHTVGHDVLSLFRDGARARGMEFYVSLLGLANKYVARTHPSWRACDAEGRHVEWLSTVVCPNSPYGDWLARQAGEIVREVKPDGIYFEGIVIPAGLCYCAHCQERWLRERGKPMPRGTTDELVANREYMDYIFESSTGFVQRIGKAIRSADPAVVFEVSAGNIGAVDFRDIAPYADVVSIERPWGYGGYMAVNVPLGELGLHTQMLRAESRRTVVSSMYICRNADKDYASRSDDHLRTNYMGLLQGGATVQLHTQNTFDEAEVSRAVITELNDVMRALRPWMKNATIAGEVALLHGADPRDVPVKSWRKGVPAWSERLDYMKPDDWSFLTPVGGAKPGTYLDDSFRGFYKALRERHVPVRVIGPNEIREGALEEFPVLVLANAERIPADVERTIAERVSAGGGLVMTYRSGLRDAAGARRPSPALPGLAGAQRMLREVTNPVDAVWVPHDQHPPQTYYRVDAPDPEWAPVKGRLASFMGTYLEFEKAANARELASVIDYDYSRMHPEHAAIGWYPWQPIRPLMVGRDHGAGRALYLGAELDGAALRFGDPECLDVLTGAVRWAGRGARLLETELPPSVEITVWRDAAAGRDAVLLVNQTTNQHYPDPVRYIVPVKETPVRLNVGSRRVAEVNALTGRKVTWRQEGPWLSMAAGELAAYEALLVTTK